MANAPALEGPAERKPEPAPEPRAGGRPGPRIAAYKPAQGRWVRGSILTASAALWGYGCQSFYHWVDMTFRWGWWATVLVPLPGSGGGLRTGHVLCGAVFLAGAAYAAWATLIRPAWSEFLIETEIELKKVSWPYDRAHPRFSLKQEFMGSAVVVMLCMLFMILFLGITDIALTKLFQWIHIGV